jgi:hypothetical protein
MNIVQEYYENYNFPASVKLLSLLKKDGHTFKKKDIDYLIYSSKLDKYNNDRYYKEFTINLNNIKEIYKKVDTSAIIEYQIIKKDITASLSKFVTEIEKINNKLEELDNKINKVEENNKKTIILIKNLHKIKSLDDIKNVHIFHEIDIKTLHTLYKRCKIGRAHV